MDHKPEPEAYDGPGRTLPGALPPLPDPSPPLWKRPAHPPQGMGDGKLPAVAPAGRYALPSFSEADWADWE